MEPHDSTLTTHGPERMPMPRIVRVRDDEETVIEPSQARSRTGIDASSSANESGHSNENEDTRLYTWLHEESQDSLEPIAPGSTSRGTTWIASVPIRGNGVRYVRKQSRIVAAIATGCHTRSEVASTTGIGDRTVKRELAELASAGVISSTGRGRATRWHLGDA